MLMLLVLLLLTLLIFVDNVVIADLAAFDFDGVLLVFLILLLKKLLLKN